MKPAPLRLLSIEESSPATRLPFLRVVIVAHGSRNRRWVEALQGWFEATRLGVLSELGEQVALELTFLEISPSSFEECLIEKVEGREPLWILPFFLSQSGFTSKSMSDLAHRVLRDRRSGWTILRPRRLEQTLGANAERRLLRSGARPGDPVIVSGYGESGDDSGWQASLRAVQLASGRFSEGPAWLWAPSGHFLEDPREPLRRVLEQVRRRGFRRLAVLPLYVAPSSYQDSLIPEVLKEFPGLEVAYTPDAILPDPALAAWAVDLLVRAIRGAEDREDNPVSVTGADRR